LKKIREAVTSSDIPSRGRRGGLGILSFRGKVVGKRREVGLGRRNRLLLWLVKKGLFFS